MTYRDAGVENQQGRKKLQLPFSPFHLVGEPRQRTEGQLPMESGTLQKKPALVQVCWDITLLCWDPTSWGWKNMSDKVIGPTRCPLGWSPVPRTFSILSLPSRWPSQTPQSREGHTRDQGLPG